MTAATTIVTGQIAARLATATGVGGPLETAGGGRLPNAPTPGNRVIAYLFCHSNAGTITKPADVDGHAWVYDGEVIRGTTTGYRIKGYHLDWTGGTWEHPRWAWSVSNTVELHLQERTGIVAGTTVTIQELADSSSNVLTLGGIASAAPEPHNLAHAVFLVNTAVTFSDAISDGFSRDTKNSRMMVASRNIADEATWPVASWTPAGQSVVGYFLHEAIPASNEPPVVTATADNLTVEVGDVVTFASTATDPDGTIAARRWLEPAGVTLSDTTVAAPTWTTTEAGTFEFTFDAQDNSGAWSEPATVTITVVEVGAALGAWTPIDVALRAPANTAAVRVTLCVLDADASEEHHIDKLTVHAGPPALWSPGGRENASYDVEQAEFGNPWAPLRGATGATSDAVVLDTGDYEQVPGTTTLYRARSHLQTDAGELVSEWSEVEYATAVPTSWWVKDPLDPSVNMALNARVIEPLTRPDRRVAHEVLGRSAPVVYDDEPGSRRGVFTFLAETVQEREAITELADSGRTLLLQGPVEFQRKGGLPVPNARGEHIYCTLGPATESRFVQLPNALRDLTFSVIEVDAP